MTGSTIIAQHHKSKKRPRRWHRSTASSARYWKSIQATDRLFKKAGLA